MLFADDLAIQMKGQLGLKFSVANICSNEVYSPYARTQLYDSNLSLEIY